MKKKNDFYQIQKTVNYDTLEHSGNFETLLRGDLKKLLGDYFNLKDNVTVSISKYNGELEVKINFIAYSQKVFCTLPNDM